ncbi:MULTISPECIES: MMPL family transporter [unclassified Rhodococcus (in: high G+C Gram-positive bacteria)]|uniref:MMPL family transporter n=1 Tax=unclassified Rhodococcus (in: high G+C Gram-positive bacteria) TaxID=192944 RepID=UPI00163B21B1|nr:MULTISPECIES: MMPL family transporter [unclassified Rhodococcus (in: high G+C Gram-positive bacteria)]MBC2639695.1 MMPL family transporter [Rhodococcus sp. 3A]MBC2895560.1 MMPL family transporter [Rhodococcus sp. 4CII]
MSSLLARLGAAAATHPWRVIATWATLLVLVFAAASAFGGTNHDDYNVPGLPSQQGTNLLSDRFPEMSGADARVVVHSEDGPLDPAVLAGLGSRLGEVNGVSSVSPPRLSQDSDTAVISLNYRIPVTDFHGSEGVDALDAAVADTRAGGLRVELGGQVPENISTPSGTAEAVGMILALVILVFAFGSVVAAGLPLAVALVGVGIGSGLITIMAGFTSISTIAPTIATMVGIGVGIDYALLLVTRYTEGLRSGMPVRDAVAAANSTAGASVVFAGTTVLVSLFGLRLSGLPMYASFGYATFAMVGIVMLTSVTLVPALCGLAGRRVLGTRSRARADRRATSPLTERWAIRVSRRPWLWALTALGVLLLLAAPVLGMRTWPQDAGSAPATNTIRQAYDLIDAEFGPGANGPLMVAVDLNMVPAAELPAIARDLAAEPGVASVSPVLMNSDAARPIDDITSTAALIEVQPTTGPSDPRSTELLERIRSDAADGVHVTGLTASFADISARLAERLWLVIAFVVALSVVLLTFVFRAPVVAVKAAVMNLLSVAAAYGVMVMVFQWGWGAELLGLPHALPVSSWVPILMFTILFGLSMDYEVFLLSRVRERWLDTGDSHRSVVEGLASTGRVITSAAAIMVAVFAGFALDGDVTVKMMGVGLATAVFIDATIVRMVLVPSTMYLLGDANWWRPGHRGASPDADATPAGARLPLRAQ